MGAAASSLPEKLTEQDLKNLCGENYNPVYFKALHDKSSEVSRDFFIQCSEGHEKEVFELFLHFCPHGDMDSRTFVKLMKDTKSMKKNKFTATDADLIFSKHKTKQGAGVKALSYCVFRNDMIPDIIAKMVSISLTIPSLLFLSSSFFWLAHLFTLLAARILPEYYAYEYE